jgi:hypothetical protein
MTVRFNIIIVHGQDDDNFKFTRPIENGHIYACVNTGDVNFHQEEVDFED